MEITAEHLLSVCNQVVILGYVGMGITATVVINGFFTSISTYFLFKNINKVLNDVKEREKKDDNEPR